MVRSEAKTILALVLTVLVVAFVLLIAKPPEATVPVSEPLAAHAVSRSGQWPTVRKHYLETHPACEVCGTKEGLELHHVLPFHVPGGADRELDTTNFVVLCGHTTKANHHLWYGHLGDYKCSNPHVREWIQAVKDRKEE